MAAANLAVFLGEIDDDGAGRVVENSLFGLNILPLLNLSALYLQHPDISGVFSAITAKGESIKEIRRNKTFCPFAGVSCPNSLVSVRILK